SPQDSVGTHTPRTSVVRRLHSPRRLTKIAAGDPISRSQKTRSRDRAAAHGVIDACAEGLMNRSGIRFACITISLSLTGCALDNSASNAPDAATGEPPTIAAATSAIQHVFVIAMENHATSSIYGNTSSAPYINNTLLPTYGRATNFLDKLPS